MAVEKSRPFCLTCCLVLNLNDPFGLGGSKDAIARLVRPKRMKWVAGVDCRTVYDLDEFVSLRGRDGNSPDLLPAHGQVRMTPPTSPWLHLTRPRHILPRVNGTGWRMQPSVAGGMRVLKLITLSVVILHAHALRTW